jgi:hypothetical protein
MGDCPDWGKAIRVMSGTKLSSSAAGLFKVYKETCSVFTPISSSVPARRVEVLLEYLSTTGICVIQNYQTNKHRGF